jgi:serine/threonine-protein kinase Chk1
MPTTLNKKYLLGRQLGTGASCKVRLAKSVDGSKRYAAKIFKRDICIDEILSTELKTMARLKHPGILNLVDQGTGLQENPKKGSKEVTYIILELAEGGELFDIIAFCGGYAEPLARYQGKQFLETLRFMHN